MLKNQIAIVCTLIFLCFVAASYFGNDPEGASMAASLYGGPLVIIAIGLFSSTVISLVIKELEKKGFSKKILHTSTIAFFSVVILITFYFIFFKFSSLPWYLG